METFHTLFGSLLGFVYHCFDRIVIQGYLPLLTRPEHIVHFFRDVHGVSPLTKDVLAKRTQRQVAAGGPAARDRRAPARSAGVTPQAWRLVAIFAGTILGLTASDALLTCAGDATIVSALPQRTYGSRLDDRQRQGA